MDNEFSTQEEYNVKLTEVAILASVYAKSDQGYFKMRDAFNELCEKSGANKGINHEAIIGRRKLMVQSVCIKTIPFLSTSANSILEYKLNEIAEDYQERANTNHRMRR